MGSAERDCPDECVRPYWLADTPHTLTHAGNAEVRADLHVHERDVSPFISLPYSTCSSPPLLFRLSFLFAVRQFAQYS